HGAGATVPAVPGQAPDLMTWVPPAKPDGTGWMRCSSRRWPSVTVERSRPSGCSRETPRDDHVQQKDATALARAHDPTAICGKTSHGVESTLINVVKSRGGAVGTSAKRAPEE